VTTGLGSLCANLLAGACMDFFVGPNGSVRYKAFWMVPAIISALALLVIVLGFKESKTQDTKDPARPLAATKICARKQDLNK